MSLRLFVIAPSGLLTDYRPHGDGLVASGFIRELASRGHELHVAAQSVDLRDALPRDAHVHRLVDDGDASPLTRLRFMWLVRRLYGRLSASKRFDLVHQLNPVDVGVSLALSGLPVPIVLGPYVPDWPSGGEGSDVAVGVAAQRIKRMLRAAQQRRAATVLLSTPAAASKLESEAPRLRVHELPPGIDVSSWLPARDGEQRQDVLFLANLEVRKGIHVALDAFVQLAPRLPAARMLIGGEGPELEAVSRRVRSSPALDRVELLGRVERDVVIATMQSCDVYCLPSYGEPFGMTALEAMACAKPVVATDAGGLRHLVPDEGGRKAPPGDAHALAAALREVLADRALRQAMGDHNRRVVEERYAWPRVVSRLEDVYRETISEARGCLREARRWKS